MKPNQDRIEIIYIIAITVLLVALALIASINEAGAKIEPQWNNIKIQREYHLKRILVLERKNEAMREQLYTFYTDVTAYSITGTMADGLQTYRGAAACPRRIPFGTWITIEGYGNVQCHDRLSKKYDHRIDIWFESYKEAIEWGKQYKKVIIK